MSLDSNKISNIIGTKLPQWVIKQLNTRSVQNSRNSRDNNNVLYLGNKTAWVRLISSIDINGSDLNYFRTIVGEQTLTDQTDLAKQYVLFGGTSIYKDQKYQLRSGISNLTSGQIKDGAYGILGKSEIAKYGYRPMPGITSVTIETQGRLGSVRSAIINFKVWDKAQLDIIDALYFKLGYTMFLEWGHTFYYNSPENPNSTTNIDLGKVKQTELLSINPFADNLTKENIFRQISESSRKSEGNYDAMLGMVTNFNFVYNQEGGYDCTLRLMSLGVLGDSIKINNPSILPNLLRDEIILLNKTLIQASISESITDKEKKEDKEALLTFDQLVEKYVKYPNGKYPKEKLGYTDSFIIPKGDLNKADVFFDAKDSYGDVFGLRRLKTIVPLDKKYFPNIKAVLDITNINTILQYKNYSLTDEKNYEKNIPSFSESIKAFFKSFIEGIGSPISLSKTLIVNSAIAIDQTQRKSTLDYEIITYDRLNRGIKNNIEISRNIFAITSQPSVSSPYYFISNEEFYNSLIDFLSGENKVKIKNIESEFEDQENWREYKKIVFTFEFDLIFNKPVTIQKKVIKNLKEEKIEEDSYADFRLGVTIKTDDTGLIKFLDVTNIDQPSDYFSLEANKQLELQNQIETDTAAAQKLAQQELSNQILEALSLQSALEISLRTIQVRALNSAFYRSSNSKADLDIGKKVYTFEMTRKKSFINQIFSNGIYSEIIQSLIYNPDSIKESEYNKTDENQFAVNAKYGFVTSLLANKADFQDLSGKQVNYKDLLKAYVVPYKIDTELIVGVKTNHPVYIPFGTLLMLLNHTCTIYDTKKGGGQSFQKPLVYIDYNPNTNFMLTNPQQLSTNPWVTLIPYQGGFGDYKNLFDKDIISTNNIIPVSGSNTSTPLFNPQTQDLLSYQLPSLKDDIIYRGKVMNILLNIDYLTNLVRDYSFKDGSNNVYLKPFLEQILSDVNKYLGNFNALRLSYNDSANSFQIVDDQLAPAMSNEVQIPANPINDNIENKTELPLLGLTSIAKSLEIKTEVSTKLSSMIAISANSNPSEQAQLSTNGDAFGFINVNYTDRYVPRRLAAYDSGSAKKNGEIIASNQFNQTISDFYSKINPSYADVSQATSFYIEKMSKVKNNDPASRASALIPVSVNLTTDGLSGLNMGQAFTIPKELLPYTYVSKKPGSFIDGYVNQVGFAIVGLTHTIEGNTWNTALKAQMLPVKQSSVFDRRAEILNRNEAEFGEAESLLSPNSAKFIDNTPWSAAFVSYVMDQTTNSFPVDALHTAYLNKIKASNTGFKLYNPRYTALQVGDIVVYNREASRNTYDSAKYSGESHGDIIVEISTNLAVGIGGNVKETVKKTEYSIDNSGKVTQDTGVFIIARPPKESVSAIIVLANREYNLWEQGTLKETNIYALPFLKKYYESVGLKIPS